MYSMEYSTIPEVFFKERDVGRLQYNPGRLLSNGYQQPPFGH